MDFRVRSRNQTTKFGVAREQLTGPNKARMSKSKLRSMLICIFDSQGVVRKELVPQRQTFNKQYYREVLERLRKRVHRVRPEIADTWMLHHDNAPYHTAISVNEFLNKKVFQWFSGPHIRLIWVRVTSSLFRNSNSTLKIVILVLWTTSKRSWQTS